MHYEYFYNAWYIKAYSEVQNVMMYWRSLIDSEWCRRHKTALRQNTRLIQVMK